MAEIKTTERKRFDEVFDEWIQDDGRAAAIYLDSDLLRSIAGFFYFQGAGDATKDIRAMIGGSGVVR